MLAEQFKLQLAVFFITTAVITVVQVDAQSQSSCTTLRNELGICVPILSCEKITQMLTKAPKPIPPSILAIVKGSHCGTFNNIHHVCCERNRIATQVPSQPPPVTPRITVTERPEVDSGPKIRASGERSDAEVQSGMNTLHAMDCGDSGADRVGNGEDAALSEFPWMALLMYDDGVRTSFDCGGSLITDQHVLTAAHCIRVGNKRVISVRLGEHDIKEQTDCVGRGRSKKCAAPVQDIDVAESIYHKDYNPSRFSNDIGLLRLVSRAVFRTSVQPICLPITDSSRSQKLTDMIIAGWGRIENGLRASVLQKAVVPVRTNDYCQKIHQLVRVTDMQMCAGGKNDIDTCKGDSGGPIFFNARYKNGVRYVQYGVVSAGSTTCGSEFPGIYSRVISYVPWIASNIV